MRYHWKGFILLYLMIDLLKNFEIGVYRFLNSNSSSVCLFILFSCVSFYSFIFSFIILHSFINLPIHSFILNHSFIHSKSFIHSFIHSSCLIKSRGFFCIAGKPISDSPTQNSTRFLSATPKTESNISLLTSPELGRKKVDNLSPKIK